MYHFLKFASVNMIFCNIMVGTKRPQNSSSCRTNLVCIMNHFNLVLIAPASQAAKLWKGRSRVSTFDALSQYLKFLQFYYIH